jgi:hypothetical protein
MDHVFICIMPGFVGEFFRLARIRTKRENLHIDLLHGQDEMIEIGRMVSRPIPLY